MASNNNPGNLRRYGTYPVVNGYVQFPSVRTGLLAVVDTLRGFGKRQINTVQKIVFAWNPSVPQVSLAKIVQGVVESTGFPEHQVLDLTNSGHLALVVYGLIKQISGQYPDGVLLRSILDLPAGAPLTGKQVETAKSHAEAAAMRVRAALKATTVTSASNKETKPVATVAPAAQASKPAEQPAPVQPSLASIVPQTTPVQRAVQDLAGLTDSEKLAALDQSLKK